MKKLKLLILLLCFVPCSAYGTTYWISPTGTAANLAACSGATPLSGTAACSWDKANGSGVAAGDTVYYRAGTYNVTGSAIAPANSGTSMSARITFSSYQDEVANFVGSSGNTRAIVLDDRDYIHVTGVSGYGITFTTMGQNLRVGPGAATGSFYNEIDHVEFGTFYPDACSNVEWRGSTIMRSSQYNYVHDNYFHDWQCYTTEYDGPICLEVGIDALESETKYNVIDNNVFANCGHHVLGLHGRYNVARGNFIHNEAKWENEGILYGYRNFSTTIENGDETLGGHHIIEGNRFGETGVSYLSATGSQKGGTSVYISSSFNLIRYNTMYNALGAALALRNYSPGEVMSNHIYNNTFYHSGYSTENDMDNAECYLRYPISAITSSGIANNVAKNNLFHSNWIQVAGMAPTVNCGTRPLSPAVSMCTTSFCSTMTYTYNPVALLQPNLEATGAASDYFTNSDYSDPTSATIPNLTLRAGVSAIDTASYLTQASGSGTNSSTLIVDTSTARYFQDGKFGLGITWPTNITTMGADWIAIGIVSNVVQISSINYATDTITLATPTTWSDNANIWLYKKSDGTQVLYGSAPDYGAYEFNSTPAAVTGITVTGGKW